MVNHKRFGTQGRMCLWQIRILLLAVAVNAASDALPPVIWMAPFFSGGGYCSEAISFAAGLMNLTSLQIVQHGDSFSPEFVGGLESGARRMLQVLATTSLNPRKSIVVCHSEPGAWYPPRYPTARCPPAGSMLTIGRTMFETDRLPSGWPERLNKLDYILVPAEFHRKIFHAAGVAESKLRVVHEAVDTDRFDPAVVQPLPQLEQYQDHFRFLSIFKWEERKGWKFLLQAFLQEFSSHEKVVLLILTNAYHSDPDSHKLSIHEFVTQLGIDTSQAPRIHLLPEKLADSEMPKLYKSANCFVLPSRGEGWGRPHVEAMSMGLPLIATHWSGPEEYMTAENSYPLRVDGLDTIQEGAFRGHKWARPSVEHLRELMRHVYSNPDEGRRKGVQARADMVSKYCVQCLADQLADTLRALPMQHKHEDL